jgi:3-hydroxyisobutyrate dehydrogenase
MTQVAFIGLGNMGAPMVANLIKAGNALTVSDLNPTAVERARAAGAQSAPDAGAAARGAEVVVTMLPAGEHVRKVYTDAKGVLARAPAGCLLIDCSTIDVETARAMSVAAAERNLDMLDAPVSGGVAGAEAASLTFMVGGSERAFARAEPLLAAMGKTVVHAGGAGAGQAAKVCNNMLLGISMIGTCEAFVLAEKLGLAPDKLFEIASTSSGQCWSLTTYCPVPGPVPASPANRDYRPGFAAAMMLKDLKLALEAARATEAAVPLGGEACRLYDMYCQGGGADADFSGIIRFLRQGLDM